MFFFQTIERFRNAHDELVSNPLKTTNQTSKTSGFCLEQTISRMIFLFLNVIDKPQRLVYFVNVNEIVSYTDSKVVTKNQYYIVEQFQWHTFHRKTHFSDARINVYFVNVKREETASFFSINFSSNSFSKILDLCIF